MALKTRNAIAFVLGVCAGRSGLRAIGGAGGRPHRLERLRRQRSEGMLHRLAAEKTSTASRDGQAADVQRGDIRLFVGVPPRRERLERGELHRRLSVPGRQRGDDGGRRGQVQPRPRRGRLRRVGLDRSLGRLPRRRGDAARGDAPVTGNSARGTTTEDTFSLEGIHRRGRGRRGALPLTGGAHLAPSGDPGREWLCRAAPPRRRLSQCRPMTATAPIAARRPDPAAPAGRRARQPRRA